MIKDLEITIDDELLFLAPRITRDEKVYIPYCKKDKTFCRNFPGEDCVNYVELLLTKPKN